MTSHRRLFKGTTTPTTGVDSKDVKGQVALTPGGRETRMKASSLQEGLANLPTRAQARAPGLNNQYDIMQRDAHITRRERVDVTGNLERVIGGG